MVVKMENHCKIVQQITLLEKSQSSVDAYLSTLDFQKRFHIEVAEWLEIIKTNFQDPVCETRQFDCVNRIKGEENNCLAPCSGLVVNSFFKTGPNNNIEGLIWEKIATYDKFSEWTTVDKNVPKTDEIGSKVRRKK